MRLSFAAVMLLVGPQVLSASPSNWHYSKLRVLPESVNEIHISNEVVDTSGGTVDVIVSGNNLSLCKGGTDGIRFQWKFDRDVSKLSPGERFGAKLEVRYTGSAPPCRGELAGRAYLELMGSMGAYAPGWSDPELHVMDSDRFQTRQGGRASTKGTSDNIVELVAYDTYQQRPNAWFQVVVATPGGIFRYCYVYRPEDAGGTDNREFPSIGGTWYREGNASQPASIEQTAGVLTFINENGGRSRGRFDGTDVIAIDWHDLRGRLTNNGQTLAWANGSSWTRSGGRSTFPLIGGTWYREGNTSRPASIEQNGAVLTFINENGGRSRGRFEGLDVIAIDWNNLRGRLLNNNTRIAWANNSNWSR